MLTAVKMKHCYAYLFWPARSADLLTPKCLLWDYIKCNKPYNNRIRTLQELIKNVRSYSNVHSLSHNQPTTVNVCNTITPSANCPILKTKQIIHFSVAAKQFFCYPNLTKTWPRTLTTTNLGDQRNGTNNRKKDQKHCARPP